MADNPSKWKRLGDGPERRDPSDYTETAELGVDAEGGTYGIATDCKSCADALRDMRTIWDRLESEPHTNGERASEPALPTMDLFFTFVVKMAAHRGISPGQTLSTFLGAMMEQVDTSDLPENTPLGPGDMKFRGGF